MSRRTYELNQRLARIEARLDAIAPDLQTKFIREGRVYQGKVY